VIIPDLNLLLYAHDSSSPHHAAAATWWTACMNGVEPVGIPRVVSFGFVRLATNSRVFTSPLSVAKTAEHVRSWFARPHVVEAEGRLNHLDRVLGLLEDAGTGGNLVTDAQIAAIALDLRATLYTNDTDFRRFPGLSLANPLSARGSP